MRISNAALVAGSVASGAVAAACFWWWARLVTDVACMSGSAPPEMDCRHDPQMYAVLGFSALAIVLLLAAILQAFFVRKARRAVA